MALVLITRELLPVGRIIDSLNSTKESASINVENKPQNATETQAKDNLSQIEKQVDERMNQIAEYREWLDISSHELNEYLEK